MVLSIRLLSTTVAGAGYHDPILSHGGGEGPDRPSCNLKTTGIKLQSKGMIDQQVFFSRLPHT